MEIKHLIFDLDGTLWDTSKASAKAYNLALREDGRSDLIVTPEMIKREFGKPLREIADDLFPEFPASVRTDLMMQCDKIHTAFLRQTDIPMLYSDIQPTLDALSQTCQMYIVSNCQSGYIEMFLQKYALNRYIADTECCGNTGKGKAENILFLMQRNHIEKGLYVGDTTGDYNAATQAGVPFVFASYGYGSVGQSCHRISQFSQLLSIIKDVK